VSGVGTGGTLTGVSRYWETVRGTPLHSVAVEPIHSPVISQAIKGEELKPSPHKIQGIGAGFVPKNLDLALVDEVQHISNDEAVALARRLAREEGILAGISCGAAMTVADRLAREPRFAGKTIVVILPDTAERYFTGVLFDGMFDEVVNADRDLIAGGQGGTDYLIMKVIFIPSRAWPLPRDSCSPPSAAWSCSCAAPAGPLATRFRSCSPARTCAPTPRWRGIAPAARPRWSRSITATARARAGLAR
jgi:hypothetical protein